jgi:hypothetical protein
MVIVKLSNDSSVAIGLLIEDYLNKSTQSKLHVDITGLRELSTQLVDADEISIVVE